MSRLELNLTTIRGDVCVDATDVGLSSLFVGEVRYIARILGRDQTYIFEREFLKRRGNKRRVPVFSTRKLKANDHIEVCDIDKAKRYFVIESITNDTLKLIQTTKANTLAHAAALDGDRFGKGDPEQVEAWLEEPDPFADHEYDDEKKEPEKKENEFIIGSVDEIRELFRNDKEET